MWLEHGTGLYHARAREYDPATGRFLTQDPAEGDAMQPQTWLRYAFARNAPTRFTDPSGAYSLQEFGTAENVDRILSEVKADAFRELGNFLKEQAKELAGDLIAQQFKNIIPFGGVGVPLARGLVTTVADARGASLGNALEQMLSEKICSFLGLDDVDAAGILYLEAPVSQGTGFPSGDGIHCGDFNRGTPRSRAGTVSRGTSFPDFMFSPVEPTRVQPDKPYRTYLIAELKIRGETIKTSGRRGRQFATIVKHAAKASYGPVAVYVSLFGARVGDRERIEAAAFNLGKDSGRPVGIVMLSIIER